MAQISNDAIFRAFQRIHDSSLAGWPELMDALHKEVTGQPLPVKVKITAMLAIGGHCNQWRTKGGKKRRYFQHVMQVWLLVLLAGGSEQAQLAAVLHDYVEDAHDNWHMENLEIQDTVARLFGAAVLHDVQALTNPADVKTRPGGKHGWQVAHIRTQNDVVKLVKTADRIANVSDHLLDPGAKDTAAKMADTLRKADELIDAAGVLQNYEMLHSLWQEVKKGLSEKYGLS